MKIVQLRILLYTALVFTVYGCANIVPPSGGKKDVTPPRLVSVSPADSLLNARVTKIELRFDEFLTLSSNASSEVQVSPLLRMPISVVNVGRRVTVNIPDSLLRDSTTYRVSFGKAIGDLHENNIFANYVYTFSTTNYFDSLKLSGRVFSAATGTPDTGTKVLLYSAILSDSAVVREKPEYVATATGSGHFILAGLPHRPFRIYALKDKNNNLVYDGGEEQIAFIDSIVVPVDSIAGPIVLRIFSEPALDTAVTDTTIVSGRRRAGTRGSNSDGFFYTVGVDTSDRRKRTVDITQPLSITFNKPVDSINAGRIFLSYDSSDIDVETDFIVNADTSREEVLLLNATWKENTLYTLRLLKGFAKDTAKTDAMPSRFTFRTKNDDDYGKLNIHLPSKYDSSLYILMVQTGDDTVYNKPVTDTMVKLTRLQPGNYTLRIIVDKNGNGVWDTGDLFAKLQPELVIPYQTIINLKAGWENTIDFEPEPKTDKNATNRSNSPGKRDSPRR